MLTGEHQRRAGDQPLELRERDDRTGEGDRADRGSNRQFDQAGGLDGARGADAVSVGREIRGGGDRDGGKPDQAVESGDQLRQRRHLDFQRDHGADGAADHDAGRDIFER